MDLEIPWYIRRLPAPLQTVVTPLYRGWMAFAHVLGWVNGRIILTVMYVVILGPVAIIRKISRLVSGQKASDTYWINKEPVAATLESLHRIF